MDLNEIDDFLNSVNYVTNREKLNVERIQSSLKKNPQNLPLTSQVIAKIPINKPRQRVRLFQFNRMLHFASPNTCIQMQCN